MGFVPYQVDYSTQNTAKTLGFTKKKVVFKFGFANPQSLRSGATGAQCRGSEHELVFLWSLKSGKRQLFLDGRDVHFSESGQNGWTVDRAWQHAFTMRDATGTYRVHFISQPKNPDLPDSKPFDMRVAGVSYFAFNRIFQLGTPTMIVRENNRDGGSPRHRSGRDSPMSPEERRLVAAAKVESLRDMQKQQQKPSGRSPSPEAPPTLPREEPNLLSFDDDPTPPPPPPAAMVGSGGYNQFASSVTLDASFAAPAAQQAPNPYGQPGPYGQPPAPYGGGYERQPSYGQSASMSQLPYGQPPAPPQQQQSYSSYGSSFPGMTPAPAPYSDPSSSLALAPYQPPTVSTEPAPSPYAEPLSTPTASYASSYQQQQQPPQQPSFASPGGQSYVSYGSAPSFAQPPSRQQQQQQPQFANPGSAYGDGGGYSSMPPQPPAPLPMQSATSGSGSFYGAPPPPAPMQQAATSGSFYAPPAPAPAPFGDMSGAQYYAGNASMPQMPPQQPQQPYGGGGGYPQQYPSY